MSSLYGDMEKDEIYYNMENFLNKHSLFELLNIVTDISNCYEKQDYNSELNKENTRLKKELADLKHDISSLLQEKH